MRTYPKEYQYTAGSNAGIDAAFAHAEICGKVKLAKDTLFSEQDSSGMPYRLLMWSAYSGEWIWCTASCAAEGLRMMFRCWC